MRGRASDKFRSKNGNMRGNSRGNFRNSNSGNLRDRGDFRESKRQTTAMRAEYQEGSTDQENYENDDEMYDESRSKIFHNRNFDRAKVIEFIADSGATSHIVNKSFILTNFKKSEKGVIKSANKNEIADIVIDGTGNLMLKGDEINSNLFKKDL